MVLSEKAKAMGTNGNQKISFEHERKIIFTVKVMTYWNRLLIEVVVSFPEDKQNLAEPALRRDLQSYLSSSKNL